MGKAEQALSIAEQLCKVSEGLSLVPYICPAGHPTIGYGIVYKPDGSRVTMDHPSITKEIAEQWLRHELYNTYMLGVLKVSPHLINYPYILAAITDFAFNLGVPRYRSSTLKRRINENNWNEAEKEIIKWVFSNGKKLPGLIKRRNAELKLIQTEPNRSIS